MLTTTTARRCILLAFVLAVAATALTLISGPSDMPGGRPVAWTSLALPPLILGNAALLWSDWVRTRTRLFSILSGVSFAAAVAILAAELQAL